MGSRRVGGVVVVLTLMVGCSGNDQALSNGNGSGGARPDAGLAAGGSNAGGDSAGGAGSGGAGSGGVSSGGASAGGASGTPAGGASGTPAGGASAGGASTGGAGARDGGTGKEADCFDNVDDDGDGKVDCADDDCLLAECTPAVPPDWAGPMEKYEGTGNGAVPQCDAGYPFRVLDGGTGVVSTAAVCADCACEFEHTCMTWVDYFSNDTCTTPAGGSGTTSTQACFDASHPGVHGKLSIRYADVFAGFDKCAPAKVQDSLPATAWATRTRLCSAPPLARGGCAYGDLCAPRPGQGFASALCITSAGDQTCPAAYPQKSVRYSGQGERCGSCCSNATVVNPSTPCSGDVTLHDAAFCAGSGGPFTGCQVITDQTSLSIGDMSPPVTVDCTMNAQVAAAPVPGSAATGATTVCCTQ